MVFALCAFATTFAGMRDEIFINEYLPIMAQRKPFTTDTGNGFNYLFHGAIIAQDTAYIYLHKKGGEKTIWQQ